MLSLINKMSWHHRKTTIIFIRENIRFREFEIFTARSKIFLFLILRIKSWMKRCSVWKIYMTQLKRVHKKIRVTRFAQQRLWIVEKIRDLFWRWINSLKHRRFDFANKHSVIDFVSSTKKIKKMRTIIDLIMMKFWISLTWRKSRLTQRKRSWRKKKRKRREKIRNRRLLVLIRSKKSKRLRLQIANASQWKSLTKRKMKMMFFRDHLQIIVIRIVLRCRSCFYFFSFSNWISFHSDSI